MFVFRGANTARVSGVRVVETACPMRGSSSCRDHGRGRRNLPRRHKLACSSVAVNPRFSCLGNGAVLPCAPGVTLGGEIFRRAFALTCSRARVGPPGDDSPASCDLGIARARAQCPFGWDPVQQQAGGRARLKGKGGRSSAIGTGVAGSECVPCPAGCAAPPCPPLHALPRLSPWLRCSPTGHAVGSGVGT